MPKKYGRKLWNRKRQFASVFRTGKRKRFRRGVRGVVRNMAESKFYTQTVQLNDQGTVPSSQSWSGGLTTGVGNGNRIGRNIQVKRITMKVVANINYVPGGTNLYICRCLVVYPRKGIDDTSVLTEVQLLSTLNRPDPAILMVLYDRTFALGAGLHDGTNPNIPSVKFLKFTKRCKYQFNFAADGEVKREPLLVFLGNTASTNASALQINGYMSMSFKDL